MQALFDYFLYDSLRGDGYAVRWARLGMYQASPISLLCWAMEGCFAAAFYAKSEADCRLWAGMFWIVYLLIIVTVNN